MPDSTMRTCTACGKSVSTTLRQLFCVTEEAELASTKDGQSKTVWTATDSRAWGISLCQPCESEKYGRSLSEKITKTWKTLGTIILLVLGAIAFIAIAGTGMFADLPGPVKLALAVAFAGIVLLGLFGTPIYLFELIAHTRAKGRFVRTGTIPEPKLSDLFVKEAERVLAALQSDSSTSRSQNIGDFELPARQGASSMSRLRISTKL